MDFPFYPQAFPWPNWRIPPFYFFYKFYPSLASWVSDAFDFKHDFIRIFWGFLPEVYLFSIILVLLFYTLYLRKYSVGSDFVNFVIRFFFPFLIVLILLLSLQLDYSMIFFNGCFLINSLIVFSKLLISIALFFIFIISLDYFKFEKFQVPDYVIIVLLSVLGMFLLILSNDFIVLYLALELQSFCLYILASLKRYSNLSIEAALKYFILGSFASGSLLFGVSLLYGYFGTTNFFEINILLSYQDLIETDYFIIVVLGLLFVSVGILFKLGIFPFHFWIADVYEGSPMIVTAFFAAVPKISFLLVFIKLYGFVFLELSFFSSQFLLALGLSSIFVGILLSLYATKIKRLLAYSAITHMGYIVVVLSSISVINMDAFLIYLITYILSSIGVFSILLSFRKNTYFYKLRNITELSILLRANPFLALIFSFFLLSSAGIPPLAGFFGKFFVFSSLLEQDSIYVAGVVILSSVVSSIYYIRLIRFILFNDFHIDTVVFSNNISLSSAFVIVLFFYLNLFFIFFQDTLLIFFNTLVVDFWNSILWFHYELHIQFD